jgi:hypothetical protein
MKDAWRMYKGCLEDALSTGDNKYRMNKGMMSVEDGWWINGGESGDGDCA